MGKVVKLSMTTAVVAVIIAAIFTLSSLALFLQTYVALTRETPVAEVVMSPIQTDETGSYIEIEFTPYLYPNALEEGLNLKQVDSTSESQRGETETYKVYGDVVALRGPFLKLHPGLLLLNFSNIYKLALIEGEYRNPTTPTTLSEGSELTLNGGFDPSWWDLNGQEAKFPYNLIVDRFTFSGDEEPGFYGTAKKRYEIVATMDTLTWNYIEDVAG